MPNLRDVYYLLQVLYANIEGHLIYWLTEPMISYPFSNSVNGKNILAFSDRPNSSVKARRATTARMRGANGHMLMLRNCH
jgi:hypothetical protein